MQRRAIVHVGMHKTGSSSIQHALHRGLDDASFEYADLGPPNHSLQVFSLFSGSPETHHMHGKHGRGKDEIEQFNRATRERLRRHLSDSAARNIIVSGEDITALAEDELRRFQDFLMEYVEDIDVVGYVRPPRSFMASIFHQSVKAAELQSLDVARLYPDYRGRFAKFDRVFGRDHLQLWRFDAAAFPGGDVVLDFCQRLGIALRPETVPRVNESLSREALSLLFAYRKFGPGYGVGANAVRENTQLIAALHSIAGGKTRFAPELTQSVLEANREDVRWMEERLGMALDENQQASADDVRSEADLLNIDPAALNVLKDLIGKQLLPRGIGGQTPQEAAVLVHALREKLAAGQMARRSGRAASPPGPLMPSPGLRDRVITFFRRASTRRWGRGVRAF
jgi:hypothetical protein